MYYLVPLGRALCMHVCFEYKTSALDKSIPCIMKHWVVNVCGQYLRCQFHNLSERSIVEPQMGPSTLSRRVKSARFILLQHPAMSCLSTHIVSIRAFFFYQKQNFCVIIARHKIIFDNKQVLLSQTMEKSMDFINET